MNLPIEIILEILNYCDKLTKIKLYKIMKIYEVCCDKKDDDDHDYYFDYFCSKCKYVCCDICYEKEDTFFDSCIICDKNRICTKCNYILTEEVYCDKCTN